MLGDFDMAFGRSSQVRVRAILPLPELSAPPGVLFLNETASPFTLRGGPGGKSAIVAPGGFHGDDGRVWHRVIPCSNGRVRGIWQPTE